MKSFRNAYMPTSIFSTTTILPYYNSRQDQLIKKQVWDIGVVELPSNKRLDRKWFMRCKTSDGWYAAATTFEIGTKDRKIYLLKAIKLLGSVDARLMLKQKYGEEERMTEF